MTIFLPEQIETLRQLSDLWPDTPFVLIGANALALQMDLQWRQTNDLDFVISIALEPQALAYEKPLCASLDGFTLHAATRAGALDAAGREALLHYVLRPPVAQERVAQRPDGLVRITLKKAYTDGTIAVDMDPLSLLCRLA